MSDHQHAAASRISSTRSQARHSATRAKPAKPTPLDCLFILFASGVVLLLLFWIASTITGRDLFNTLPGWLSAIANSVWTKITAGAGAAGSLALRRWLDKRDSPNYLLWIGGCVAFLILGVLAVRALIPPLSESNTRVPVQFSVDSIPESTKAYAAKYKAPIIRFQALAPEQKEPVALYEGQDHTYPYSQELDIPVSGKANSLAEIYFIRTDSQYEEAGNAYDFRLCLKANPSRPFAKAAGSQPVIRLVCSKNVDVDCRRGEDDPGYVSACDEHVRLRPSLIPAAFAAEVSKDSRRAGWVVPSLETLERMTDRERVGYTRFDVTFEAGGKAASADQYYFALRVNGDPVYVDGLLPERRHFPLQTGISSRISFALENLNFTGIYQGFEKLQLDVTFLQGQQTVWQQKLERDYIALRDAPEARIPTDVGTFVWTGNYVVPKNENRYEILVSSTQDVNRAMAAKARFSEAQLAFNERAVALVVRPPLRQPPYYGLALGLVLPSKQVQFTFNADEARDLCRWAVQQSGKGAGGKLIEADLRRYEVATRGYSPCR